MAFAAKVASKLRTRSFGLEEIAGHRARRQARPLAPTIPKSQKRAYETKRNSVGSDSLPDSGRSGLVRGLPTVR